jgi:hypothetical protein
MRARASPGKIRQTYEFIKTHRNRFNIRTMCRVLEVAPSGFFFDSIIPKARTSPMSAKPS